MCSAWGTDKIKWIWNTTILLEMTGNKSINSKEKEDTKFILVQITICIPVSNLGDAFHYKSEKQSIKEIDYNLEPKICSLQGYKSVCMNFP